MFGLKWVIVTREVTIEPGSTSHMVMLVSSNKACEASSYAKSAYLSTPALRGSRVSQVLRLAIIDARIILVTFSPFYADREQKGLRRK